MTDAKKGEGVFSGADDQGKDASEPKKVKRVSLGCGEDEMMVLCSGSVFSEKERRQSASFVREPSL